LATQTKSVVAIGKGRSRDYAGRVIFGDPNPGIHSNEFPHEALRDKWPIVYDFFEDAIERLGSKISTKGR